MSGTLVILRHGQSEWNLANLFTGWHDVALTELGATEATAAGITMRAAGLRFDTSHTSLQARAVVTQSRRSRGRGTHRLWPGRARGRPLSRTCSVTVSAVP